MIRHTLLSSAALLVLAAIATPSRAAVSTPPSAIIPRACDRLGGDDIDQVRLGQALLIEAGVLPSEFVADELGAATPGLSPNQAFERALIRKLGLISIGQATYRDSDRTMVIRNAIWALEVSLRASVGVEAAPLRLSALPTGPRWLFQSESPTWTMRCKDAPRVTIVEELEEGNPPRAFAIRAKPEELALTGRDARAAGAFSLGVERTRTVLDDGTNKTVTAFSVNGTVGLRLSGPTAPTATFAYARYSLQRSRTTPAPVLAAGTSQGDGDTNALETGLLIDTELLGNESEFKLFANTQVSITFDFANDSSRGRLRSVIRPAFPDRSLLICRLGSYEIFREGAVRTRCGLQVEVEAARVFEQGRTPLGNYDDFLAIGARGSFELFVPTAGQPGVGLLAGVSYRRLEVLHGPFDRISRVEAQFKHRFWTTAGPGIDLGISYVRGRNEVSYERENVLRFGIGIVL